MKFSDKSFFDGAYVITDANDLEQIMSGGKRSKTQKNDPSSFSPIDIETTDRILQIQYGVEQIDRKMLTSNEQLDMILCQVGDLRAEIDFLKQQLAVIRAEYKADNQQQETQIANILHSLAMLSKPSWWKAIWGNNEKKDNF